MGAEPSVPGAAGLSAECQSQTALVAISAVLEARNASEEWGAIHLRDAGDYREASLFVVRAQHIGQSQGHEPAERPGQKVLASPKSGHTASDFNHVLA